MTENKNTIPETAEIKPLTDEQLDKIAGGEEDLLPQIFPMYKRCSADPSHIYSATLDACPECGAK